MNSTTFSAFIYASREHFPGSLARSSTEPHAVLPRLDSAGASPEECAPGDHPTELTQALVVHSSPRTARLEGTIRERWGESKGRVFFQDKGVINQ